MENMRIRLLCFVEYSENVKITDRVDRSPYQFQVSGGPHLRVSPATPEIITGPGQEVSLVCRATINPSICLWKTPYQAIYSIGGGRVWEDGRISSPPSPDSCSLLVQAVELKDDGVWQCEVGAVVEGEFTTTTAETLVSVVSRAGGGQESSLVGLEGAESLVRCGRGGRSCRWTSPSGHTFSLQPGDYAERGRLQADNQCGLRISSLQERDAGTWTCQANTDTGRPVETVTQLVIESECYHYCPHTGSSHLHFSPPQALGPDLHPAAGGREGHPRVSRQQAVRDLRVGDPVRPHGHLLQTHQQRRERQAPVLRVLRHGLRDRDQRYRSEGQRRVDVSSVGQCGGEAPDVSRHCETVRR